ncbi:MAG TPA: 16S rRNA (cytidine(1402)-2'-O)-methyltransferase [Thermodesulfobacteriota bacterium]|nr:16S rRNA (cytidine(1402)-2'-O)-methyltransferase [Thermodesulfobacteriota bacterium]
MTGTLYVVSTPIGNLEDITLRAIRVLKEVELVAAEDTRSARKLFSRYDITTPVTSYFEHNEEEKAAKLVTRLLGGGDVALISEAGTPGVSDPGYRLIRLALENSIPVVPVPGPSALIAALSVAGLPLDEFTFKGFVPSGRRAREKFFLDLLGTEHTFIVFETARRIRETLEVIIEVLGDLEMVVAREVTKLYEEFIRGMASEVARGLSGRTLKGELTVLFRTGKKAPEAKDLAKEIEDLLATGLQLKEVVKAMAREFSVPRSEVYKVALKVKERLR